MRSLKFKFEIMRRVKLACPWASARSAKASASCLVIDGASLAVSGATLRISRCCSKVLLSSAASDLRTIETELSHANNSTLSLASPCIRATTCCTRWVPGSILPWVKSCAAKSNPYDRHRTRGSNSSPPCNTRLSSS